MEHALLWTSPGAALLVLVMSRVAPQLLVRLAVRFYPRDDRRGEEILGEVYFVPGWRRLAWALEQSERAISEGIGARLANRQMHREQKRELAAHHREALREAARKQDEAEFDAFLRGVRPGSGLRHAAVPHRRPVAPMVLLGTVGFALAALSALPARPGQGLKLTPASTLGSVSALHVTVWAVAAVLLGLVNITAHTVLQRSGRQHRVRSSGTRQPAARVRKVNPAIPVQIDLGGVAEPGVARAWTSDRVFVTSDFGQSFWLPAWRVRRA